ncbi:uncharacterized protein LOC143424095 [Xylocopa sonorina]|uniref:uncharacterized protein LOC143424095 n=1 Tax=Xylocopa sonorina TaxID=1818115 RepID=UPI00403B126A
MDIVANAKHSSNEDKIQAVLDVLKEQIDRYDLVNKELKVKSSLTRSQRIRKLTMEEKQLSVQFSQIKKEIKHYEKKYEKVLKKKVKLMRVQVKEGQNKLEQLKQGFCELNKKVDVEPRDVERTKKMKSKKARKPLKVRTMKLRQKTIPLSKKIRIKIKRNEKLGRREMHFISDGSGPDSFTDLVKVVQPRAVNTRECRIMLQKLTEEQMSRYVSKKRLEQQREKKKGMIRRSGKKTGENAIAVVRPNWHIRIPKSIFEESQKEFQSTDINMDSTSKDV